MIKEEAKGLTVDTPAKKPGCGKGCLWVFLAILAVSILTVLWSELSDDSGRIEVSGNVVIGAGALARVGATCADGPTLHISPPQRERSTRVSLSNGTSMPDGACIFNLSARISDAETYAFRIGGLSDRTVNRRFVDTVNSSGDVVLDVTLRWD